ncbi:MAG: dihydropteroate synthase [Betaproteobacteria bacterium TMED82]|nr:MAG: dihydropteroate synthase [Betaproteobacteria bacterium TMED82]|tara:strand:+ start:127306 stop:128118 length:813 start_codon:yes stop_codon:yes gene_type:complete
MGILNLTPDSFSDGGIMSGKYGALSVAEEMIESGVDILDIGGESTRPGAAEVGVEEEWTRIKDVVNELIKFNIPISIDTRKAQVMRQALSIGVDIINDVSGFRSAESLKVVKEFCGEGTGFCVMHMQGEPKTMQINPRYIDVVAEVEHFLSEKIDELMDLGALSESIVIDPGFGFGKTAEHNFLLFKSIGRFISIAPVLIGISRKRLISELSYKSRSPKDRLGGSLAAALWSISKGVSIVRVHDVKETVDAIRVLEKLDYSQDFFHLKDG